MVRRRPRPPPRHVPTRTLPWYAFDGSIFAAVVVVRLAAPDPGWIEAHYSNGLYPVIDRAVRTLTGPLPFCLGDVLIIAALALLGRFWFGVVRSLGAPPRRSRRVLATLATLGRAFVRTAAGLGVIYLWFMVSWAFGYARVPLVDKIVVHEERTDEDSVNRFADRVEDELTRYAAAAHAESPADTAAVAARLTPRFEATIRRFGDAATFAPPRIKPTLFQPLFAASGTTGFTDPWTHEVNLDASLFAVERPAILAHEWSHLSGFNDESEANFIAVIACTTSDDALLRYSGWLLVWANLPSNVHLTHRLGRLAFADLTAIRARYVRNINRQVEKAGRAAYDGYLKSNHVKAGFASYGTFIRWMTAADFDAGGLPIVKPRTLSRLRLPDFGRERDANDVSDAPARHDRS